MKRLLLLMLTLLGLCLEVHAQKGLAIQSAFDELAVRQNATEVVMGAGRLKKYRLRLFHSLEMKNPSAADCSRIEALVQTDARLSVHHEENGGHRLYELPSQGGVHKYIFYRPDGQSLILIYIEGKASLEQIKSQFLKKR